MQTLGASGTQILDIREDFRRLKENICGVIRGKETVVDHVLVALVAGGHVLVEDLPGVGKTTLAYSLARSIRCDFSRIQFTSDLLPSDILGVSIFNEQSRQFEFRKGPVFANIVLADEINRTTPKTQSSLLEAMERAKVTVDGTAYDVGLPFMVFATQNPVDFEGTFPLPESQMDRFLLRLSMGYPSRDDEMEILRAGNSRYDEMEIEPVVDAVAVARAQRAVNGVYVEETLLDYLLRLVTATRNEVEFRAGISTRGLIGLKRAAQARALICGRDFVIPEDVQFTAVPVLAHRLSLRRRSLEYLEERATVSRVLNSLLESVAPPV